MGQSMKQISLLIATKDRKQELFRLLQSLRQQRYDKSQLEIYIADQNKAAYLEDIFIKFSDLPLTRVLLPSKGVSTARNALLPLAQGEIIAFPDDDCWYAENTLEQVVQGFQRFPNTGGLLGIWAPDDKQIRQLNFCEKALGQKECFHMGGTCVQFFRKELVDQVGTFDEKLGPGTTYPYGCGEDTDFLLRVHQKSPIIRIPSIHVYHPAAIASHSKRKIKAYAAGRMYLLKKHHFSYLFQLGNVLFPLVQIPKALLLGDIHSVCYRWAMFCGRLKDLIR